MVFRRPALIQSVPNYSGDTVRSTVCLALLLVPLVSSASDTLTWSGRLLDSIGAPLQGETELTLNLYPNNQANPAELLHGETLSNLAVSDGYATMVLGEESGLPSGVYDAGELWVQVVVGGSAMSPLQSLSVSPAAHTTSRLRGDGGQVSTNATTLTVWGTNTSTYTPALTVTGSAISFAGETTFQQTLTAQADLNIVGSSQFSGTVQVDASLSVDGHTHIESNSMQIGNRHILTINGTSCTNDSWTTTIDNGNNETLMDMRMSFSHCGGGCHYANRHWEGYFNFYSERFPTSDEVDNTGSAGAWTFTRTQTGTANNQAVSERTIITKSAANATRYCGPVDIWLESNQPMSVVSQTN